METQQPTDAELDILRILWQRGPSTVRDVHEAIGASRGKRYTTTLKQLQVMARKKLVSRDASRRSHVYTAALDEGETRAKLVSGLIDRLFDGSSRTLILHAIEARDLSGEELAEIRRLIAEREAPSRLG
jgi:predicted transcriptional regulator